MSLLGNILLAIGVICLVLVILVFLGVIGLAKTPLIVMAVVGIIGGVLLRGDHRRVR